MVQVEPLEACQASLPCPGAITPASAPFLNADIWARPAASRGKGGCREGKKTDCAAGARCAQPDWPPDGHAVQVGLSTWVWAQIPWLVGPWSSGRMGN